MVQVVTQLFYKCPTLYSWRFLYLHHYTTLTSFLWVLPPTGNSVLPGPPDESHHGLSSLSRSVRSSVFLFFPVRVVTLNVHWSASLSRPCPLLSYTVFRHRLTLLLGLLRLFHPFRSGMLRVIWYLFFHLKLLFVFFSWLPTVRLYNETTTNSPREFSSMRFVWQDY